MNLRRKLIARLMATIAVGGLLTAGPVAVGAESASAAVGPDPSSGVQVDAGYLRVGMDTTGQVTSLVDRRTGQNHLVAGHGSAPWSAWWSVGSR